MELDLKILVATIRRVHIEITCAVWSTSNQDIGFNPFTTEACFYVLNAIANYLIGMLPHLTLCLADAIHNFEWVKSIQ